MRFSLLPHRADVCCRVKLPRASPARRPHRRRASSAAAVGARDCGAVRPDVAPRLQPGYLYGIVLGAIFVSDATDRDEGRETFWGSIWTLVAAILAWVALTWLRGLGLPQDGFGVTLLSTAFAATLVAGLEAAAFALMPMASCGLRPLQVESPRVGGPVGGQPVRVLPPPDRPDLGLRVGADPGGVPGRAGRVRGVRRALDRHVALLPLPRAEGRRAGLETIRRLVSVRHEFDRNFPSKPESWPRGVVFVPAAHEPGPEQAQLRVSERNSCPTNNDSLGEQPPAVVFDPLPRDSCSRHGGRDAGRTREGLDLLEGPGMSVRPDHPECVRRNEGRDGSSRRVDSPRCGEGIPRTPPAGRGDEEGKPSSPAGRTQEKASARRAKKPSSNARLDPTISRLRATTRSRARWPMSASTSEGADEQIVV